MSERGRVIAIFAVVGLVALGGCYYFFKIYRPAQDLKNAQAEIVAWETRWDRARGCLLGKSPPTAKTSDALAIHEMAPDPWDRGSCTPLISKLSRGDTVDTGIPAIEKAWGELDGVVSKTAMAFAQHVGSSTTVLEDPLPAALDALDGARAKLRTAAKLPDAQRNQAILPVAQIIPIALGGEPVTGLDFDSLPSAHGVVMFGRTGSKNALNEYPTVQLVLSPGAAPQVARISGAGLRSVPDMTWGAIADAEDIRAGAMDRDGAMPGPGDAQSTFPITDQPSVAVAIGTPASGTLVFGNATSLTIAHSTGVGIKADPPMPISWATASMDPDGRAVLMWRTPKNELMARILKPGDDGTPEPLSDDVQTHPCLTADSAWVQGAGAVIAFGTGGGTFRWENAAMSLVGCSGETALLRDSYEPENLMLCTTKGCRPAVMPTGAPGSAAASVIKGRLVAIASYNRVLGVWRGGMAPAFYSLPETAMPILAHEHPAMATTDGKVIDVIARGAEGFVLIRIPAA